MRESHTKALRSCFQKAKKKTRQTSAHQQIQKNCANKKIKVELKVQSFANKAVFFQATNGGQKKDKSLFLDPNKKNKVRRHVAWKKMFRGLKKEKPVKNGMEVVGLAANPAHSGTHVYVKRQGNHVVDFFTLAMELPGGFPRISSAQKLNSLCQTGFLQ